MSLQSHKRFNTLLNSSVEKVCDATFTDFRVFGNTLTPTPLIPLFMRVHSKSKTRITRDQKSGSVLEAVRKVKLWNLNLHIPQNQFDIRFTLNIETIVPPNELRLDTASETQFQRHKDRISYVNENMGIKVDLTQVGVNYTILIFFLRDQKVPKNRTSWRLNFWET